MTSDNGRAAPRKRRRRRRRGRGVVAAPAAPLAPDPEEDKGPIAPAVIRGADVTIRLPVRSLEILEWMAQQYRQTPGEVAARILRSHLTAQKSAFREATIGTMGATARKGAEFDRLSARLKPDTA